MNDVVVKELNLKWVFAFLPRVFPGPYWIDVRPFANWGEAFTEGNQTGMECEVIDGPNALVISARTALPRPERSARQLAIRSLATRKKRRELRRSGSEIRLPSCACAEIQFLQQCGTCPTCPGHPERKLAANKHYKGGFGARCPT